MILNGDNYRTLQFHRDSPEKWQVREVNNVQPDVMRTKSFACDHAAGLFTFPFNIRNQKFVITAQFRPLCQFALTSACCSARVYSPPCPVWHSACSNRAGRWGGGLAVNYLSTPLHSFMATPFPPSCLIHRFLSTLLAVASFLAWQFLISLCLPFRKPAPPSPSHFPIWEGINFTHRKW